MWVAPKTTTFCCRRCVENKTTPSKLLPGSSDDRALDSGTNFTVTPYSPGMNNLAKLFLALSLLLTATSLFAETHPNFSGTWKLDVSKSETGSEGIAELTVDVDHKDPVFTYTAKGTAGGQDFEETESFTTDGKPSRDSHGANVTAHWDGTTLVAEATGDDGSNLYTARLTLSEDGKSITRVVKQRDDPQPRHEVYEKQ